MTVLNPGVLRFLQWDYRVSASAHADVDRCFLLPDDPKHKSSALLALTDRRGGRSAFPRAMQRGDGAVWGDIDDDYWNYVVTDKCAS